MRDFLSKIRVALARWELFAAAMNDAGQPFHEPPFVQELRRDVEQRGLYSPHRRETAP